MQNDSSRNTPPRRGFLKNLGTGSAAIGLAALASSFRIDKGVKNQLALDSNGRPKNEADLWFDKISGSHRIVYDAPQPHSIFPFAWPKVFLLTNAATGSPEEDCSVVVVLRHNAICYAFKDSMWEKYNFVDVFKAGDIGPAFQAADAATALKTRNPFWNAQPGDFKIPGFGSVPISIPELQASGVMFCVCHAAMTVNSTVLAGKTGMKQVDILHEWEQELIPGIQLVPSGVWALGRAQEHGCHYIFAG